MFGEGSLQDVHIWKNKAPVQNPLLCEEDGPVYQLRRWYEQFYVDKADVTPEMTERFEFEVDTTKANEFWRAEVAENLAKKAAEDEAASSSEGEAAEEEDATARRAAGRAAGGGLGWSRPHRRAARPWRTSSSTPGHASPRSRAWT